MRLVDNDECIPVLIELMEEGREVAMTISGSSMNPFLIHHRDSILMKKPDGPVGRGDMVFYRRASGAYVMHRVHHVDRNGKLYMAGDAQTEIEGPLDPDCVFAIITKVKRKGKWIQPGDFWWFFFRHIWIRCIPLRRLLMRIYGAVSKGGKK